MPFIPRQITTSDNKILSQFVAEVEFGAPSKDCRNFGICRVIMISKISLIRKGQKKCKCNNPTTLISFGNEKAIEMIFFKTSLTKETNHKFFSNKFFIIEEDFCFNSLTQSKNGFTSYKVRKGVYPIVESLGTYIIEF